MTFNLATGHCRSNRLNRLIAVTGTVLLVGVLWSTAYADPLYDAAKAEGGVTIYIQEPSTIAEALIAGFNKIYPGIKVEYFRSDTTQIAQRLETESAVGQHIADVAAITDRRLKLMDPKLFQAFRPKGLEQYGKDINPDHHLWSIYGISLTSYAWNTSLVSAAEAPKTWEDLLDPKWKGKVGMQDPLAGGGVASWIATMYSFWGEKHWAAYMKKLGLQKPIYGKYQQVQNQLGTGELAIMVAAYPDYIETVKAKGAPIEWGNPSPMVSTTFAITLLAQAPHPNAGKLLINYIMSPAGQAVLAANRRLPALQSAWPEPFATRLANVKLIPSADTIEREKADFFRAKSKEYFGDR